MMDEEEDEVNEEEDAETIDNEDEEYCDDEEDMSLRCRSSATMKRSRLLKGSILLFEEDSSVILSGACGIVTRREGGGGICSRECGRNVDDIRLSLATISWVLLFGVACVSVK